MKLTRLLCLTVTLIAAGSSPAQILDKQKLLDAQTFWDNRDWDWYKANIPFFECPDADITTTYYYRWELLTKHLTYGSPNSGYSFTEFIDRPFWSGAYGAISCPAGHQLYEARWLRDRKAAYDYAGYWFLTPGAQPRRYSTWLADAVWAVELVHPYVRGPRLTDLLGDLVKNYEEWERRHFVPEVGLFWQTGHDDGMEYNINSRQTQDLVHSAPGFRPTLNSYMWADARAIAKIAHLADDSQTERLYLKKADAIKENLQKKLWDEKRDFFFHMAKQDEERDGATVKALSLTHQTGKNASSPHGRELIGYVPWQFNMPDPGYEAAWKYLMDRNYFYADYGPTTVERGDPLFHVSKTCCWWSGNSWPYATTQTLKAMANLLQNYKQDHITKADYLKLLTIYAKTHRKNGKPYIAEACHPDSGSWDGHDSYNHSEHYFHSGYIDLIITGLVGLNPRDDGGIDVRPLAPASWDYFALDDISCGHHGPVAVIWDRNGTRYGLGKGFHILKWGKKIASSDRLEPITIRPPSWGTSGNANPPVPVNYAVNNDGGYFPKVAASYTAPKTSTSKLIDGNYWYHRDPPNRWTCEGSPNAADWCVLDFGVARHITSLKLYFLDDGAKIIPPQKFDLEYWDGKTWKDVLEWWNTEKEKDILRRMGGKLPDGLEYVTRTPPTPTGRRANEVRFFGTITTSKFRARFIHAAGGKTGLTEFEAWGNADLPVEPAPPPTGNLAFNPGGRPFPKASASFTSRFDKVEHANDGKLNFNPTPNNRWTCYESPSATDWLQLDFGAKKTVARVELALYDDGGGVQAPAKYVVQHWDGNEWRDAANAKMSPEQPVGGQINEVRFDAVQTDKLRVVFTHKGKARSGVTEMFVWPE